MYETLDNNRGWKCGCTFWRPWSRRSAGRAAFSLGSALDYGGTDTLCPSPHHLGRHRNGSRKTGRRIQRGRHYVRQLKQKYLWAIVSVSLMNFYLIHCFFASVSLYTAAKTVICDTHTSTSAPLQLSESSLHKRKLPSHSVRYLDNVKLQLITRFHPLTCHPPSGQHHRDRRAAVGEEKKVI